MIPNDSFQVAPVASLTSGGAQVPLRGTPIVANLFAYTCAEQYVGVVHSQDYIDLMSKNTFTVNVNAILSMSFPSPNAPKHFSAVANSTSPQIALLIALQVKQGLVNVKVYP